jgi:hypothetical protein
MFIERSARVRVGPALGFFVQRSHLVGFLDGIRMISLITGRCSTVIQNRLSLTVIIIECSLVIKSTPLVINVVITTIFPSTPTSVPEHFFAFCGCRFLIPSHNLAAPGTVRKPNIIGFPWLLGSTADG